MGNNKKKKKQRHDESMIYYMHELKNKKVPLLTLDQKWHELFPDFRKTASIKKYEKKLNNLIKKQGQTSNDLRDYEKAKKTIMENIVNNMTDGHQSDSGLKFRKQEKNQKLMGELNDKITRAEKLMDEIPDDIQTANKELLIESMLVCYEELSDNTSQIDELEQQIAVLRNELKDKILAKQDMEMRNTQTYKYMHNLLGGQIVEIFDKNHNVWKGNVEENKVSD